MAAGFGLVNNQRKPHTQHTHTHPNDTQTIHKTRKTTHETQNANGACWLCLLACQVIKPSKSEHHHSNALFGGWIRLVQQGKTDALCLLPLAVLRMQTKEQGRLKLEPELEVEVDHECSSS